MLLCRGLPVAHPAAARRSARATAVHAAAAEAPLEARVGRLTGWCAERGAAGSGLTVFESTKCGRGVVATRRIEAGETCLDIPLSLGIADVVEEHPAEAQAAVRAAPWFARLACRLLQERVRGEDSEWAAYLALVEPSVAGSPLCDGAVMSALSRYPPLLAEALALAASVAAAHAQLLAAPGGAAALVGASAAEFRAAASVAFSRAYGLSSAGTALCRVCLPLADLLNHGGDEHGESGPSWPPVLDRGNMRWEVVDGGSRLAVTACAPLEPGVEAMFSYREQSNDTFLLYYGFVPANNPHDDVVLYQSLDELLAWRAATQPPTLADADAARAAVAAVESKLAAAGEKPSAASQRLKVLAGGRLDNRAVAALTALCGSRARAFAALAARCAELDTQLAAPTGSGLVDALLAHKRRILGETVATLEAAIQDEAAAIHASASS